MHPNASALNASDPVQGEHLHLHVVIANLARDQSVGCAVTVAPAVSTDKVT